MHLLLAGLEGLLGYSSLLVLPVSISLWQTYHLSNRLVGGTESLGITAGETKNPTKNMPKIVKFVFWRSAPIFLIGFLVSEHLYRIMIFYICTVVIIGLNGILSLPQCCACYSIVVHIVPWNYPDLSNRSTTTSPFTLVFTQAGSSQSNITANRS